MTPLTFVAAATDACAQHLSQNSLNSFQTASKVTTVISIIRLFSVGHAMKTLLPKETRRGSCALLAGTYALGSYIALKTRGQKPPLQTMHLWFALLSLTTHVAQVALSKSRLGTLSQAVLEVYSLYRMVQQPWIHIKRHFSQDNYSFKCAYHSPVISQEDLKTCVICIDDTQTTAVSNIAPTCPTCAELLYKTKINEFILVNLPPKFDFLKSKAFANQTSLPTCPITRSPLEHNAFSLCIYNGDEGKWQPIEIEWIRA